MRKAALFIVGLTVLGACSGVTADALTPTEYCVQEAKRVFDGLIEDYGLDEVWDESDARLDCRLENFKSHDEVDGYLKVMDEMARTFLDEL